MNRPQSRIAIENQRKYGIPPTLSEIEQVIKDLKIPAIYFERFCGIPEGTIYQIRRKKRELPSLYWHHIYQQKVPSISHNHVARSLTEHKTKLYHKNRTKSDKGRVVALK